MNKDHSLVQDIRDFFQLLSKYSDEPKNLTVYTNFIKQFIRKHSGNKNIPTIEMMTVLRHKKPIIFSLMRRTGEQSIHFLTHVEVDLEAAKSRLDEFYKEDE